MAGSREESQMKTEAAFGLYKWDSVEREEMNPLLVRQFVAGDRSMLARLELKKGCIVPLHSHENEQISYILEGALRFKLGTEDDVREVVVGAGEVLVIPGGMPHSAEALEDTLDLDVFCPPRQDWISKKDAYLR